MNLMIAMVAIAWQATAGTADDPSRAGRLVQVAGGGTGGDGSSADRAELTGPFGVGFDGQGTLFFVEMTGNRVRKIGPDGLVTTLAGSGKKGNGGDDGPAARAELNGPHSLEVARNGDIYVADTWNNRVRKIDARTGRITNVAGTGHQGFSGDGGPATQAEFGGIYCLALDENAQTLDLADLDNRRIRRIDLKTGIVTTVAGNGKKGVPADGTEPFRHPWWTRGPWRSTAAATSTSWNAAAMPSGSWTDRGRSARWPATAGRATPATAATPAARLNGPKHLTVNARGNVLIADTENHRIRVYHPADGTIPPWPARAGKGPRASVVRPPTPSSASRTA